MVNVFTGTTQISNLVQTTFDRYVEFALRSQPHYRSIVDKRVVQPTNPGASIVFNLYADLATAKTPLTETVDPDSVGIPQTSQVTVTLEEYGNPALVTRKLRLVSLSDVDPAIADIIAFNMVDTLDEVILDVARVGTQVVRENGGALVVNGGTTVAVTATDILKSRDVRVSVSMLRNRKAMPRVDSLYVGYINPDVSYDLRSETGASNATWRAPHEFSAAGNIWGGVIGEYEGAMWVETPRTYSATDGAASARVHRTLIFARQAIAEGVAEEPSVRVGPVTDKLMRFRPVGWYGLLGWSIYRQQALCRIETAASVFTG